jgi:hypothetical protein
MHEFWNVLRSMRGELKGHDKKPLTLQEYDEVQRFLCKVRVDTWRALADELNGNHAFAARALMDVHELDVLSSGLDHSLNEDNPLYRWLELSRRRQRFDD